MYATITYGDLLTRVDHFGKLITRRGMVTKELLNCGSEWDMQDPIIRLKDRNLNMAFMFAEAYWIITGRSDLAFMKQYCAKYANYCDDGITMSGAYGIKYIEQRRYVIDAFREDKMTRQAVMTFWRPCPRTSKDIPCTIGLQFIIDGKDQLHTIATMRSSDTYLGIPYDVFSFSMITRHVLLALGMPEVTLGTLTIQAGSQHIYETDFAKVTQVMFNNPEPAQPLPLDIQVAEDPTQLEETLLRLANSHLRS